MDLFKYLNEQIAAGELEMVEEKDLDDGTHEVTYEVQKENSDRIMTIKIYQAPVAE